MPKPGKEVNARVKPHFRHGIDPFLKIWGDTGGRRGIEGQGTKGDEGDAVIWTSKRYLHELRVISILPLQHLLSEFSTFTFTR